VPKEEKIVIEKNKGLLLKEFRATEIFTKDQDDIENKQIEEKTEIKGGKYVVKISIIK
jgi:hypothetical protein